MKQFGIARNTNLIAGTSDSTAVTWSGPSYNKAVALPDPGVGSNLNPCGVSSSGTPLAYYRTYVAGIEEDGVIEWTTPTTFKRINVAGSNHNNLVPRQITTNGYVVGYDFFNYHAAYIKP